MVRVTLPSDVVLPAVMGFECIRCCVRFLEWCVEAMEEVFVDIQALGRCTAVEHGVCIL